jgi:hypothetical protein
MERLDSTLHRIPVAIRGWAEKRYSQGLLRNHELGNPNTLVFFYERENVAIHEEGHAQVARALGWTILVELVESSKTGQTKTSPNTSKGINQLILDAIAISAGGELAEDMCNISDHSGCGYDRGKQKFLASLLILLTNSQEGVDSVIGSQRNRAKSLLGEFGIFTHQQNSMALLRACA